MARLGVRVLVAKVIRSRTAALAADFDVQAGQFAIAEFDARLAVWAAQFAPRDEALRESDDWH